MLRLTSSEQRQARTPFGPLHASLAAVTSLLRGLPLLLGGTPRTPLRVLCIVALDTIHVCRCSRRLPRQTRKALAAFLDFQACTNAMWDGKRLVAADYQALRQRLEKAGLELWITEYLRRVGELETRRPSPGGHLRRFDEVRSYREAVARLSLATIAAIALNTECLDEAIAEYLDEAIGATDCDRDVAALFRMAMQCQIIDDVVDYREDLSAGLPSFLTASRSLPQAMALTAKAARSYAASPGSSAAGCVFPLQVALSVVTAATKLLVRVASRVVRYDRRGRLDQLRDP